MRYVCAVDARKSILAYIQTGSADMFPAAWLNESAGGVVLVGLVDRLKSSTKHLSYQQQQVQCKYSSSYLPGMLQTENGFVNFMPYTSTSRYITFVLFCQLNIFTNDMVLDVDAGFSLPPTQVPYLSESPVATLPTTQLCLFPVSGNATDPKRFSAWIMHYKSVGTNHIYIYDSGGIQESNLGSVIEKYKNFLTVYKWNATANCFGDCKVLMMNHCLYKHRQNTKYLLFVDLDEILVFKSGNMGKIINDTMFDKDFAWVKFDSYDIYPLQHSNLRMENTTQMSFCTDTLCTSFERHVPTITYSSMLINTKRVFALGARNAKVWIGKVLGSHHLSAYTLHHFWTSKRQKLIMESKKAELLKEELKNNPNFVKSLIEYHSLSPYEITEGYSQQLTRECELLKKLVKKKDVKSVLEIGFNGGHSSELFLKTKEKLTVTSFDIGIHDYLKVGKDYIDIKFPKRHDLVLGNSLKTIPDYSTQNPDKKFDLIFIDGGHTYDIAYGDLINCKKLAHENTIVIMDDTIYTKKWEKEHTNGPTNAWVDGIKRNIVKEISREEYFKGRGVSWGKYVL